MRIILYTGKGGVGKTTAAAATAIACAERGYRTLVMSTDPAHSLADAFDRALGPEPTAVAPNLWGQEIDVYYAIQKHWGTFQDYVREVLAWRGVDDLLAEEMSVLPGMEEAASLLWVHQHYHEGHYDVILVDCAPTAETLRLLSLPDVGRWWVDKILPVERRAARIIRPLLAPFSDMPIPEDETFDAAEELFQRLDGIHQLLLNPEISSVRVVLNPEKMVIKESQRTYTYLNLYGYQCDAVICNRLIPEEVEAGFLDAWRVTQEKYLRLVEEAFHPLPILLVPFFEQEVVGLPMLKRMGVSLFRGEDPAKVFFRGQAHRIEVVDGKYHFMISLPFVQKGDISLHRVGDELTVQVGNYRRNFILPRALIGRTSEEARFENNWLTIVFS